MYLKLETRHGVIFVLLVFRNIENLLTARVETSSDLFFCRKKQVFSCSSVRGKLNLKQQNFPGREIPPSGGRSNTGRYVFLYILWSVGFLCVVCVVLFFSSRLMLCILNRAVLGQGVSFLICPYNIHRS